MIQVNLSAKSFTTIGLFQEKATHPMTDGILKILMGGGIKDSGNPGGRGVELEKVSCRGHFD